MGLYSEIVFLVEGKSLLIVALDMEHHACDVPGDHAVLDGLSKELARDAIAPVRLQYRDSHDVALLGSIGKDVFLA